MARAGRAVVRANDFARWASTRPTRPAARKRWDTARKFLDYLEANAETYWQPPQFQLGQQRRNWSLH